MFFGLASDGREVAVKKLHVLAADAAHRELSIAREFKGCTFEHVMPFIDSGEDADTGEYFLSDAKSRRESARGYGKRWRLTAV